MRKKRVSFIFMIMCYVIAIGYAILILGFSILNKPLQEQDTLLCSGTISSVSSYAENEDGIFKLKLKEYKAELVVYITHSITDKQELNNLKIGDIIEFRIAKETTKTLIKTKKDKPNPLETNNHIELVSLRNDNKDIITLDKYNFCVLDNFRRMTLTGVIVVSCLTILGITFNNVYQKQKLLLKSNEQKSQT